MDLLGFALILHIIIGLSYVGLAVLLIPGLHIPTFNGNAMGYILKGFMGLFLLGCGMHHLDLAYHGASEGTLPSQTQFHGVIFSLAQVIGAPGALIMAYYIRLAASSEDETLVEKVDDVRDSIHTTESTIGQKIEEMHDTVVEKQEQQVEALESVEETLEEVAEEIQNGDETSEDRS